MNSSSTYMAYATIYKSCVVSSSAGTLAIGNINKKHGIVMSPLSYIWYSSAKKKLITYAEVMHDVMCS